MRVLAQPHPYFPWWMPVMMVDELGLGWQWPSLVMMHSDPGIPHLAGVSFSNFQQEAHLPKSPV
jgi:hypothetical protein